MDEALKSKRIQEIVDRYKSMVDIFIPCIDRDGIVLRRQALDDTERKVQVRGTCIFVAEVAWEEIETWVLAGLDLPTAIQWEAIRKEVDVKEEYFEPLVQSRRLEALPGRGRKSLGLEDARRIDRILQRCPEDFDALTIRLERACA